ncbi:MAG: serine hydrolase domain-containing protein [Gemmatimonadota bacterium]|nr:serine hydrolase domain-containing protein [Gemmatimonadota bacterium]
MRSHRASGIVCAGLLFLAGGAEAQRAGRDLTAAIDSIATEAIESGRAAGMTIGIERAGEWVHLREYGLADVELDVPTPEGAVYEIGSVTKQFTAAALMLLVEEGAVSLDDDVSKWFPDYPLGGRRIPVRRLLDHTSGIKGYTEMESFRSLTTQALEQDSLIALFAAEPFDFEPGEALIYNNSAYFLVGKIIEKASGRSYEEFIEERVFGPAGMRSSRYCHKDELTPQRAKGYQMGADGLRPADYLDHRWPYSAGSLCSTVEDLATWNQALHGDGEGGTLLTPASYAAMITPGTLEDGTPVRYAKGLMITSRDGQTRIAHGGGIFGYLSELRYLPDEDLSIVVLINTAGPVSPSAIATAIEDLVLGEPAPVVPRAYSGDRAAFEGVYRGASRGRRMTVTVSADEEGLRIRQGTAGEGGQVVHWLGGTTFGAGDARYRFIMEGGRAAVLQLDQVGGLYVLERVEDPE